MKINKTDLFSLNTIVELLERLTEEFIKILFGIRWLFSKNKYYKFAYGGSDKKSSFHLIIFFSLLCLHLSSIPSFLLYKVSANAAIEHIFYEGSYVEDGLYNIMKEEGVIFPFVFIFHYFCFLILTKLTAKIIFVKSALPLENSLLLSYLLLVIPMFFIGTFVVWERLEVQLYNEIIYLLFVILGICVTFYGIGVFINQYQLLKKESSIQEMLMHYLLPPI